MSTNTSTLCLKVAIFAAETTNSWLLKSILEVHGLVQQVVLQSEPKAIALLFKEQDFNALFIDIFSMDVNEATEFIEHMRETYPVAPICLFSELTKLATMPDVSEYWRNRLEHFFKLPSNQTPDELSQNADEILHEMVYYLQKAIALDKVGDLAKLVQDQTGNIVISSEQRDEIEEIVDVVEQALKKRSNDRLSNLPSIIPGIGTSQIEQMINNTLDNARHSLKQTTSWNIVVLLAGFLIVFVAFIFALVTREWESVQIWGGLGMAGVIAALITNPLKSIGSSANRIVHIQIVYFQFLNQLRLLNQDSDKISILEKSKRLEEVMQQTVKMLAEYGK